MWYICTYTFFYSLVFLYGSAFFKLCFIIIYTAPPEMVDKAKEIVKKLTFGFESDAFENPGERGYILKYFI